MSDRDRIAAVLGECCTNTYTDEGELWALDVGTISLHYLADALIAAGVTLPGVTEREKARACWCEKVLKRGLFGTEWKCCLRAGHDGECR